MIALQIALDAPDVVHSLTLLEPALILIVPGWLLHPHGKEQRDVAAVYRAIADRLRSIGTERSAKLRRPARKTLTDASVPAWSSG